ATDVIPDEQGKWLVRAVPNKFPVLLPEASPLPPRVAEGWRQLPGYGHHEVIIETPEHEASLGTMSPEQVRRIIEMYRRRYMDLAHRDGHIRQIVLFENHGIRAGTSLAHPHSQIVASPVVSPETRVQMAAEVAFFDTEGGCGRCHVLERELKTKRRIILESEHFITLAPYASEAPYQFQIIPRRHCPLFTDMETEELDDLAAHLHRVMGAFFRALGDPHYNLVVHAPPLDQVHYGANHWFIDVVPRITTPAGFELGSGITVNVKPPEEAAAHLRDFL
ncbi:MAG: DUF4931 domain-containing protein, partial [Gammaproteobacteria bacterium]